MADDISMYLLRQDLVITQQPGGCRVKDLRDGEVYELGEIECFLIDEFRYPYQVDQIVVNCNETFGVEYKRQDIESFINLLFEWGLLEISEGQQQKATEDTGETNGQDPSALAYGDQLRQPNRWHLFNPQSVLDGLYRITFPLSYVSWLVPVLFAFGAITVMLKWDMFLGDVSVAVSRFGLLGRLMFAAFTINLAAQISRGLVARHYGLSTPSFGFLLVLGLVPRFNVRIIPNGPLSRETRLRLTSIATLVRLSMFGAAVTLWASTRSSGSSVATIAVELALLSVVGMIFASNPLWQGDGSNFLSALFDVRNIQQRSRRALLGLVVKQPPVITRYAKYELPLAVLGLASVGFFAAVVGFIVFKSFQHLEQQYQGAGVSVFLLLVAYVAFTIRRQSAARKNRTQMMQSAQDGVTRKTDEPGTPRAKKMSHSQRISYNEREGGGTRRIRWLKYGMLLLLVGCLFLPYEYETGGEAEVFPFARVTIASEMDAIVEDVFVNTGDWVEAGSQVAKLSDNRQIRDLRTTEAAIDAKKYEIEQMRTTPSEEEVQLAQAQLETTQLQAKYSQEKLERLMQVYEGGGVSLQEIEDAREAAEIHEQKYAEAKANLDAVKVKVNPNQISTLMAELRLLGHEAEYYARELDSTLLRSPIEGRVMTKDLRYLEKSYLEAGQTIMEIEDTRKIFVQVVVPESDIHEVETGDRVRLRLWAYPNQQFIGQVDLIDPTTEETDVGRMVTVTSQMENPEEKLKSGLTGHGKIQGDTTVVLLAFSRALMRFIRIEVWSWLP